jgi:hypothetical protein
VQSIERSALKHPRWARPELAKQRAFCVMTLATRLLRRTAAGFAGIDDVDRGFFRFIDELRLTGASRHPGAVAVTHSERPSPTAFRTHA